jgi:phosphatidylinositol alpha-1,6-mannosyltransferase
MALLREARPDARWTIVGDGTLRPGLERRVQELGLTTSVSFLGSLDDAALTDALHSAHVFCLLSRPAPEGAAGEGFGIVFIEAGAHGLPVVAGRTPGVVDAVRQGRSGLLVDPTDPRAAADAIVRVLGDAELSDRLSAGGRARAAELEWPHVVRRYATLITKTLEEPSVGTGTRYPRWLRDVLFGPR